MDRNKEKQGIPEAGSVSVAGEMSLQSLIGDSESVAVGGLPFQGQQIRVYSRAKSWLKEPVVLSMMRSARTGDTADLQKWPGLRMIISEYKGLWSGLGIGYTSMLLRTGTKEYAVKIVSFGNTFLLVLKAG